MTSTEHDPFRDTWIRYLGYSNEVGEAFGPLIPRMFVNYTYLVATGYVLADTYDKGYKKYMSDGRLNKVAIATADALIWQMLASVIIPGFTINRISKFTLMSLNAMNKKRQILSPRTIGVITVFVGLASIPFIIHPIDHGVTVLMDNTYRKVIK